MDSENELNADGEATAHEIDRDEVLIKERVDHSHGSIVFDGRLLKTHSMAGCFMTVTPRNDGHLNVPDNLKVLRVHGLIFENTHTREI